VATLLIQHNRYTLFDTYEDEGNELSHGSTETPLAEILQYLKTGDTLHIQKEVFENVPKQSNRLRNF
jgi:hypothetical protein